MEERKIQVDGIDINFARFGNGQHPVLLLPGVLGSIWLTFTHQLESLDQDKFTWIAWEPPGYGKSRPPNRTFPDNFYHRDATWACNLMKTLGYKKFSVIGYCDGGITSLILAATYPENIRKMITVASKAYLALGETGIYKNLADLDRWSKTVQALLLEFYGEEYLTKTWNDWIDTMLKISEEQNGNLCKELLPNIKCPTLIIQGTKDALVFPEHPTYLHKAIVGSKIHIFEEGTHNLYVQYPEELSALITQFLSEPSNI